MKHTTFMNWSNRRILFLTAAAILLAMLLCAVPVHAAGKIETPEPGKMILTDYTLNDCLELSADTEIVLNGTSEIGDGAIAIDCYDYTLTISGTGSIKMNGGVICKNFSMSSGTVTIDQPNQGEIDPYVCLSIREKGRITGGKLTCKTVNTSYDYGTAIGSTQFGTSGHPVDIEISNGATVIADGGRYAVSTGTGGTLTVDGASLTAKASTSASLNDPTGIASPNIIIKNKANVSAEGALTGAMALGYLSIDDSDAVFKSGTENIHLYGDDVYYPMAIGSWYVDYANQNNSKPGKIELKCVEVTTPSGYKLGTTDYSSSQSFKATPTTILDSSGKVAYTVVIKSGGHKWDSGTITKAPTKNADGIITFKCADCGTTKTEKIAKLSSPDNMKPGADAAVAEAAILSLPDDKDPAGTTFGLLQLKAAKTAKTSIKLTWKKVDGATKYIIFANACGKGKKYQKLTTVTGKSFTAKKVAGAKLKKGTYYKFLMVAVDKDNKVVSTSKTVHAGTAGGKAGNPAKVTTKAKKNKVTVKAKKTFKLAGKQTGKSIKKHRAVSYETSDAKIATVTAKGVIKGVKKGKCKVYAYAQNGVCAVITVTVK